MSLSESIWHFFVVARMAAMVALLGLVVLATQYAPAAALTPGHEPPSFDLWARQHRPEGYSAAAESQRRCSIYAAEAEAVRAHNERAERGLETYTQAVNKWSDLTTDEWAAAVGLRGGGIDRQQEVAVNVSYLPEPDGAPAALDWRAKGAVTG